MPGAISQTNLLSLTDLTRAENVSPRFKPSQRGSLDALTFADNSTILKTSTTPSSVKPLEMQYYTGLYINGKNIFM
jgi:hypothetical protein